MNYSGLTVKNGRLINDRPVGKSGIEQAAEIRKAVKMNEKAIIVANGIAKAEMREKVFGK